METLQIGQTKLTWLNGGDTNLDGGAMFGVVPKVLWSKKYPVNEKNQIELRTDPILVQKNGVNLLIDSGVGSGKLNEKQLRNFGVTEESSVDTSLKSLGLIPDEIDIVIMTHLHFDHASGLTMWEDAELVSAFKQAKIFTLNIEWNEMKQPNIRSKNTYWKENWEPIQNQILTFQDQIEVVEGITMFHSGGHSDGHSVVVIKDSNEIIVHMGDLMPTHAHSHVLWVLAYDDYPITSIEQKQKWLPYAQEQNAWLTFYHDAYCRAIKWNSEGEIVEKIERNRV